MYLTSEKIKKMLDMDMVWFPFGLDLDIDFKSNLIQIQVLNAIKAGKSRAEACSFFGFYGFA